MSSIGQYQGTDDGSMNSTMVSTLGQGRKEKHVQFAHNVYLYKARAFYNEINHLHVFFIITFVT